MLMPNKYISIDGSSFKKVKVFDNKHSALKYITKWIPNESPCSVVYSFEEYFHPVLNKWFYRHAYVVYRFLGNSRHEPVIK